MNPDTRVCRRCIDAARWPPQSNLTPAALMGAVHLSISLGFFHQGCGTVPFRNRGAARSGATITWPFRDFFEVPAPASWAISREDARVDVDAAPCLPTSGRQYRPRTVQCRSRRSFMKEMVGELSRCRRTHLIQINALTLIKINAL